MDLRGGYYGLQSLSVSSLAITLPVRSFQGVPVPQHLICAVRLHLPPPWPRVWARLQDRAAGAEADSWRVGRGRMEPFEDRSLPPPLPTAPPLRLLGPALAAVEQRVHKAAGRLQSWLQSALQRRQWPNHRLFRRLAASAAAGPDSGSGSGSGSGSDPCSSPCSGPCAGHRRLGAGSTPAALFTFPAHGLQPEML